MELLTSVNFLIPLTRLSFSLCEWIFNIFRSICTVISDHFGDLDSVLPSALLIIGPSFFPILLSDGHVVKGIANIDDGEIATPFQAGKGCDELRNRIAVEDRAAV